MHHAHEALKNAINDVAPPPYGKHDSSNDLKIPAVTILDAFSQNCFEPEMQAIPVSRVDFNQAFDYYDPKFVLIESAWQGNQGHWTHQLVGSRGPKASFADIISSARSRDIPVVFWNKEDPPHYEDFLPVAKEADLVLTTAGELQDSYKAQVGHNNVGVLPFAAQPQIHHPFGRATNEREICFAGQYFAHKYPERREQMEYLFPAAANHDFTIYSRELGSDPNYAFPYPYDSLVRGSMPYSEMVEAYRRFKIFINVNSVTTSSTMCARRIFEIAAAGTTIVSAPSPAIGAFYRDDEVFTPGSLTEAAEVFESLLGNDQLRQASVLRAWRRTLNAHTYNHRVKQILSMLSITDSRASAPASVLVDIRGAEKAEIIRTIEHIRSHASFLDNVFLLGDEISLSAVDFESVPTIDFISGAQLVDHTLIVVSAKSLLGVNAISDMVLAASTYVRRGPMAKVAYNAQTRPTYSTRVELEPMLWAVPANVLGSSKLHELLVSGVGRFDTLDHFNLLDTREVLPSSSSGWEV